VDAVSTYCAIHDIDEPDRTGDYAACLECGHVYRTRRAFWWAAVIGEVHLVPAIIRHQPIRGIAAFLWSVLTISPDDLTYCPHCSHDWMPRNAR
jgi:hypothetical protein